jgi:hypothetical protein
MEDRLCRLDVFGKTEAAGQRGVGEEGVLVDLAAAHMKTSGCSERSVPLGAAGYRPYVREPPATGDEMVE